MFPEFHDEINKNYLNKNTCQTSKTILVIGQKVGENLGSLFRNWLNNLEVWKQYMN